MEKALQVFNYKGNDVRTTTIDGEPWFLAADVCRALEINNPGDAVGRLDEDEKGIALTDTPGGMQKMIHVNEPGLYALTLTSRKPKARDFRRWVTHEVLPQIRKTGSYMQPKSPTAALLQAVTILHEQEQRLAQVEASQKQIRDTVVYRPDKWREEMNRLFNRIVDKHGKGRFAALRRETYALLQERAHVDLDRRLSNLKGRLAMEGATATAISKANRLDCIEADPKLREIYASILKEYAIKEAV